MMRMSLGRFIGIMMLVGFGLGASFAIGEGRGWLDQKDFLKFLMMTVTVTLLVSLPYTVYWWRNIDEAVKEAHKWAWFWGASICMALVVCLVCLNLAFGLGLDVFLTQSLGLEGRPFEAGFIACLIPMIIGYGIAWAVWWLRHR